MSANVLDMDYSGNCQRPIAPPEAWEDSGAWSGRAQSVGGVGDVEARDDRPIVLRHVSEIVAERREPQWLIYRVVEASVLAVLVGPRSTYKSFIALHWAMTAAKNGHCAVILSGEGAGLDRRVDAWMRKHGDGQEIVKLPVLALEQVLNLNTETDLARLQAAIVAAKVHPALVVVDTLSKFSSGLDENSNADVAAYLTRLGTIIRDQFDCTVLIVAHTGHSDQKRARGAYTLMANPDAEYVVSRPDARSKLVTVTRERFKDSAALEPLAYEASVIDLGRIDRYGDAVTSLALSPTDLPERRRAEPTGKNQQLLLAALRERVRATGCDIISSLDLREIANAQALGDRRRFSEVRSALERDGWLIPAAGGYRLGSERL